MRVWLRAEWKRMRSTHRKWTIGLLVVATTLVNQGVLHGSALHWTQLGIVLAGAFGVRLAPSTPAKTGD